MPQFQYTAVNQSGKKLSGIIGAETEEEARKQLNTMSISVLSLSKGKEVKKTEANNEKGLPIFEFEAYDPNGRKILGTIPAQNRYKAFKRLMEEYKFEVAYVVNNGASEQEKEEAKKENINILKAEYEAETQEDPLKTEENIDESQQENFLQRKKELLKKVDLILEKIRKVLQEFSDDISPENKKMIQAYIDKLLRIKSSTNLEYIEHTSEELLKKIQDQELFLHKERKQQEKESLRFETQRLMASLRSRPSGKKDISDNLKSLSDRLKPSKNPLAKFTEKLIKPFIPSPEIKAVNEQIHVLNSQLWTLMKLWVRSKKETKKTALKSIRSVLEEKKRLKKDRQQIQQKERLHLEKKAVRTGERDEPLILDEINTFLGFLLAFYLAAYFISYYSFTKVFKNGSPLGGFNLLNSPMLRNLLISLLLWHGLLSLRLHLLRYQNLSNVLILSIGIIVNASLLFNL